MFINSMETPNVTKFDNGVELNTIIGKIFITFTEKRDLLHLAEVGLKMHYMARATVVNTRMARFEREKTIITVKFNGKEVKVDCEELYDYLR